MLTDFPSVMLTPRIHVDTGLVAGTDCILAPAASRHVAQVLRMRIGDPLALFTGGGGEFAAEIVRIERGQVAVRVVRHVEIERESPWPVTLVQAVIAADAMDLIVRKAVELGAFAIRPCHASRSQRMPAERGSRRVEHWRQIAIAACEQCGRNRIPEIHPIVGFDECVALAPHPMLALDRQARASIAAVAANGPPRSIVVGPEGGLVPEEIERVRALGGALARLGARVLRAETAALAALATVNAVAGDAR